MTIRPPRRDELETLRAIELAAGQAFIAAGMPEVPPTEPPGNWRRSSPGRNPRSRATRRVWR
jgi:hypothetical protein